MNELFKMSDMDVAKEISQLYQPSSELPWNITVDLGFGGDAMCVGECPDVQSTGKDGPRYRAKNCGHCRYFMGAQTRGAAGYVGECLPACCGALLWQQRKEGVSK